MHSRRLILVQHYSNLVRKFSAWAGVFALLATLFVALPANAAELSSRSATLSDSTPSSTTDNVTYAFTFGSAYTVKGIDIQLCNSPLQSVSCAVPTGGTMANASTTLGSTSGGCAGFAFASQSATDYKITNSGGNAVTSSSTCSVTVNGVTNPSGTNSQFYFRIITYTDTAFTLPTANGQDFGAMAVSTTQVVSETANVQESLVFCTGTLTPTSCSTISGSTVTLSPNPMGANAPSTGTAYMDCATNGTHGYVITYNGTTFTDTTSDTIDPAYGTQTLGAGGSEQFGFNLVANSGGNFGTFGAAPSGGSGSASSPYATNNQIAYGTGGAVQVASASGASTNTEYDLSFGANVSNTTKAGAYTASQTFIATATY